MSNKVVDFISAKEEKANNERVLPKEVQELMNHAKAEGMPEELLNELLAEAIEESTKMNEEVDVARKGAIRGVLKEIGIPDEIVAELETGSATGITKYLTERDLDYGIAELEPLPVPLPMGLGISAVGAIAVRDNKTEKVLADCVWHVIPIEAKEKGLENSIKRTNTMLLFANTKLEG